MNAVAHLIFAGVLVFSLVGCQVRTGSTQASENRIQAWVNQVNNASTRYDNSNARIQQLLTGLDASNAESRMGQIDREISIALAANSEIDALISQQFLDNYFRREFAASRGSRTEVYNSLRNRRQKLATDKEALLTLRSTVSELRVALRVVKEAPVTSRPATAPLEKPEVTRVAPKDAEADLAKIRSSGRDRAAMEKESREVLSRLESGSIIIYDGGLPTVVTPRSEGKYLRDYSLDAVESLSFLSRETKGIMGLSGAPELTKVIDVIFEHIRKNAAAGKPVDIALALDTTGSMSPYIEKVKADLSKLVDAIGAWAKAERIDVRLALVVYRDEGDTYVSATVQDFSTDLAEMQKNIKSVSVNGGGDEAEAALDALLHTQNKLSWKRGAQRRVVLISDAPAKPTTVDKTKDKKAVLNELTVSGTELVVYPVVARR